MDHCTGTVKYDREAVNRETAEAHAMACRDIETVPA